MRRIPSSSPTSGMKPVARANGAPSEAAGAVRVSTCSGSRVARPRSPERALQDPAGGQRRPARDGPPGRALPRRPSRRRRGSRPASGRVRARPRRCPPGRAPPRARARGPRRRGRGSSSAWPDRRWASSGPTGWPRAGAPCCRARAARRGAGSGRLRSGAPPRRRGGRRPRRRPCSCRTRSRPRRRRCSRRRASRRRPGRPAASRAVAWWFTSWTCRISSAVRGRRWTKAARWKTTSPARTISPKRAVATSQRSRVAPGRVASSRSRPRMGVDGARAPTRRRAPVPARLPRR